MVWIKTKTMKIYLSLILSLLFFGACGQTNPLQHTLYPEEIMLKLKKEIGLKNKKFNPEKRGGLYRARPQGNAVYVKIEGVNAAKVNELIAKNSSLPELKRLYPDLKVTPDVFFIKGRREEGTKKVVFQTIRIADDGHTEILSPNATDYDQDLSGKWVADYYKGPRPEADVLLALLIREEFKRSELPEKARLAIEYTDYMIDTNTYIYKSDKITRARFYNLKPSRIDTLIRKAKADGIYPVKEKERSIAQKRDLEEFLTKTTEVILKEGPWGFEMDQFENHVELYLSKEKALELKRRRRVMGSCSMDNGPIIHATNIARLAGETCCMEIFLRSHLDILNDNFERMIDASYAQPGRKTYGKELEALGVDFRYLVPGILLRADHFAVNHYYGELNRTGRAMAELDSKAAVYRTIETLIADRKLDLYNRLCLVFFAEAYNYNLKKLSLTTEADANLKRLKVLTADFPVYVNAPLYKSIDGIITPSGDF